MQFTDETRLLLAALGDVQHALRSQSPGAPALRAKLLRTLLQAEYLQREDLVAELEGGNTAEVIDLTDLPASDWTVCDMAPPFTRRH